MIKQPINKINIIYDETMSGPPRYWVDIHSDNGGENNAAIAVAATQQNAMVQAIRRVKSLLRQLETQYHS